MTSKKPKMSRRQVAKKQGFESGLEQDVFNYLKDKGLDVRYEEYPLEFVQPEKKRKYTPDIFVYDKKGNLKYVIETKGRFTMADRQKMKWVKEQHPDVEFRLLFERDCATINKKSSTTYADWAKKAKFLCSKFTKDKPVPDEWIEDIGE